MIRFVKTLWFLKTHSYALLALYVSIYGTATAINNSTFLNPTSYQYSDRICNKAYKRNKNLNNTLLFDYMDLVFYSETMRGYGLTVEEFNHFFEEGLFKSIQFYTSSAHIYQSDISNLIATNLCENSNLNHQIKKPRGTKTNLSMALNSLSQFSGEWHGNWKETRVHHLWLPVREYVQEITDEVTLMAFQSCFTGDGFGWNYVIQQNNQIVILGFVFHFNADKNITSKNPHYAFSNHNNELIWVSEDHIYYEFVCNSSNCFEDRHYVISGAAYNEQTKQLKFPYGFQTIYVPNNENLPVFKNIQLN